MSIEYQILGGAGRDNALWVRVDSGQQITRLLFDCGDGCLAEVGMTEILGIDHLFFSHLHMDHVSGFDNFFRCLYGRDTKKNQIWGPLGTAEILQHRFRGYWWNLIEGQQATWRVTDISDARRVDYRFELSESFAIMHVMHEDADNPLQRTIVDTQDLTVDSIQLSHHGASIAYRVREKSRQNIQMEAVGSLGLKPGPWMQAVKDFEQTGTVEIDGRSWELAELRDKLIVESSGKSIAYLTDFLLDEPTFDRLTDWLGGCQTLVCEAQYRCEDIELAANYHHATTDQVSRLAAAAEVQELVLFHLSDRYDRREWGEMLEQARANFSNTTFPSHWEIS